MIRMTWVCDGCHAVADRDVLSIQDLPKLPEVGWVIDPWLELHLCRECADKGRVAARAAIWPKAKAPA